MASPAVRVGTAGCNVPSFHSAGFPGAGSHLERYAQRMNCAEINTSFYRPHRPTTWQRWAASVPQDFRFSVKAPRTITHEAALQNVEPLLRDFLDQARLLGDRLGPLLFQLPPKLVFHAGDATEFLCSLREMYEGPAVIEPRHATWFNPEVNKLLAEFTIARCAADPPVVDAPTGPGGWNGLVYYRLHGSPRMYYDSYPDAFLRKLADRLSSLRNGPEAWCIFDNTASGAALGDALRLCEALT